MHANDPTRAAGLDPTRAAGLSPREAPPAEALRGGPPSAPNAPSSLRRSVASSLPSFTLIEMVVVVAIILLLLALIVPAATTLWNERKVSAAENTIQGLLMTTRARALQTQGVETGFLAFVDPQGAQHLVTIEQAAPPPGAPMKEQLAWQNIFVIRDEPDHVLPAPMRVVPRYAVFDEETTPSECPDDKQYKCFSAAELANNDFERDPPIEDQAQRHRNFFTMIFSTDGQLLINRDVLIQDPDLVHEATEEEVHRGDRTGLRVGPGPPGEGEATTSQYYLVKDDGPDRKANMSVPVDPNNPDKTFGSLVTGEDDVALNFPSVDGLLVYDDALFNETPPEEKHEFLRRTARPLYVSRWTGAVVRGPVGESPESP